MTVSSVRAFSVSERRAFSVSNRRAFSVPEARLPLGEQDLHLWLCSKEAVVSSDQFRREVLSHYALVMPGDWRFMLGEHGKPALVNSPRPLDFNLSHSGDWLACAVTAGTAVGVDVERCDSRRDVMKLARRFFRAAEIAALEDSPVEQQLERFYDYWTLKEAQVKSRGAALGRELEATGFRLASAVVTGDEGGLMHVAQDPPDNSHRAHYCLLEPLAGYRLATCWLLPRSVSSPCLHLYRLHGYAGDGSAKLAQRLLAVSAPITVFDTGRSNSC